MPEGLSDVMTPVMETVPSPRTDLNDGEVVERVRRGDTDLFEVLMRRYNQRLFRAVRSIVRDDSEAEDVVQEAYVKAFMHLHQFQGRAAFATWLTRIAVHEAFRRQRQRRRFTTLEAVGDRLESPKPTPESRVSDAELRGLLEASVDSLPQDFRSVFVLRDVEGLSTAETAAALEIPAGTVKTRLHRARREMQRYVGRAVGESVPELFAFGFARCDRLVAAVLDRIGKRTAAGLVSFSATARATRGDSSAVLVQATPADERRTSSIT